MATFYVNGSAAFNGNGTTSADATSPGGVGSYNAVPSNTLTAGNTWLFMRGSTLALGAGTLSCQNNVTIADYGTGATPIITTSGNGFTCNTATTPISMTNIEWRKTGPTANTGLNVTQMTAGSFTARGVTVSGWQTNILADRSVGLDVQYCTLTGDGTSYGLQAQARNGNDCNNWTFRFNTITCGAGINLRTALADLVATGAFNNCNFSDNTITASTAGAISLSVPSSQQATNLYMTVQAPSTFKLWSSIDGGRDGVTPANWPPYTNPTQLFSAGTENRTNFGLFTVSSVTTNSLVVTAGTLVNELGALNKGMHMRDTTRLFNNCKFDRNVIDGCGSTPVNLTGMVGGSCVGNVITDAFGTVLSAGIELINCTDVRVHKNVVDNIQAPTEDGDVMGIMADGACQRLLISLNKISNCPGVAGVSNSGAGLAIFESTGSAIFGNLVINCRRGFWAGGPGSTGNVFNNTFAGCDTGYVINSSPAAAALVVRNNLVIDCDETALDSSGATKNNNAYWNNLTGTALGTAPITTDPKVDNQYAPTTGSALISAGTHMSYIVDFNGAQFWNPPSVGWLEYFRPRMVRTYNP